MALDASIEADSPLVAKLAPDWRALVSSPAFLAGVVVAAGIVAWYWRLVRQLPTLWSDDYYSHGPLIPLISAYVVARWWPRLREIPIRPSWAALLPLPFLALLVRSASVTEIFTILSFSLLATLILGVAFVAGWRWALALSPPILYLGFALPIWTTVIDTYTNPLQNLSTDVAYQMLKAAGQNPFRPDVTTIYLDRFTLDIGVPCSGLKLTVALSAFTIFFVLIARLRWWGNVAMLATILPLALFINGLRITLIGIVGNNFGYDAGMRFHDYSGYLTLLICFMILFGIAKALGWKK